MGYRSLSRATAYVALVGVVVFAVSESHSYTFDGNALVANGGRPQWPPSVPVVYKFNQNTSDAKPNIETGSDPRGAVNAAFAEWSNESDVTFTQGADTVIQNGGLNDGTNLITFEDTASNNATVGGFLAVTLFWWVNNTLVDADVIYNSSASFTTLGTAGQIPIQPLSAHEIGHAHGLEHSASFAATMFPFLQSNGTITEGEDLPSALSHDDRAGANQLYPSSPFQTEFGGIGGGVTLNATEAYGAHVVAVHEETGILYGANLTLGSNQGSNFGLYDIQGLPPGNYKVYAEPMDGPTGSGNWTGNFGAGQYWGSTFTSGFQTTFHGGNASPSTVAVVKAQTTTADIALVAGSPTINPRFAAFSPGGAGFASSRSAALNFAPGDTRDVAIVGAGISTVPSMGITCSDPNVTIDTSARVNGTTGGGTPFSIFQVTVPANAFAGARNLLFQNGSEVAVYTGGLYVNDTERLMPPNTTIWADFANAGPELGTLDFPVATVAEALLMVKDGGTIIFDPGTSSATLVLDRDLRLESTGGSVKIGV